MKHKYGIILNIVLPIIIGTLIYLILSPNAYVTKFFWRIMDVQNPFSHINIMSMPLVIRLVRFHLCDALWAYALTYSVVSIIGKNDLKSILKGCYISAVFLIIIEGVQILGYVVGTFDFIDILIQIIAALLAGIIHYKKGENKE